MSMTNGVSGQFSQENRTRNTAIGAGVGAAAGAGVGYLTKGIASVKDNKTELKNDVFMRAVSYIEADKKSAMEPFVKVDEMVEKVKKLGEEVSEKTKVANAEGATEEAKKVAQEASEKLKEAKSNLSEAKKGLLKSKGRELKDGENIDNVIEGLRAKAKEGIDTTGIRLAQSKVGSMVAQMVKSEKEASVDDMKRVIKEYTQLVGKNADLAINTLETSEITEEALKSDTKVKEFFGKIQEAVQNGKNNETSVKNTLVSNAFESGKKKLKEIKEGASDMEKKAVNYINKAAKSVKLKQAAIVGAATAAIVGLTAFIVSKGKKEDAAETQGQPGAQEQK